jgi:hypothetical protein
MSGVTFWMFIRFADENGPMLVLEVLKIRASQMFFRIKNRSHSYLSNNVTYYRKIYTFATTGTMLF